MIQGSQNKIKEAAVRVISKEGFFNTRMQDVAAEADLAVGTIYNYFSSKDKILKYIFAAEIERRVEFINKLKAEKLTIKKTLIKFLKKHFSLLAENPHLGRVLVREKSFSKGEKSKEIKNHMNSMIKMLEDLFETGIKRGEIKKINTHLMAVYFFGSMQGIIEYALTEPEIELLDQAAKFITARIDHIFV